MWTRSVIEAIRTIKARENWSREQIIAYQCTRFRKMISTVWRISPFYREYYSAHGITERQLSEITERDLPIINKEILMEHFDQISEDPLLKRDKIEAWMHSDAPLGSYSKRYVVVHTSGTGGTMGIFAHDRIGWTRFRGMVAVRGNIHLGWNPFRRNRFAFYGAVHGRFAGITSCITAPSLIIENLICSVLDPIEKTIEQLNGFQPDVLIGYSSALGQLARRANLGDLNICPRTILSAGEILTESTAELIEKSLGHRPVNLYAASESMCIAIQRQAGPGLSLMEDENVVEILDDGDKPVPPGKSGRIVLTNLQNLAIPIIRYDMRDIVTRGYREEDERFEPILRVDGRANEALPIRSANGTDDSIHPAVLGGFFVPGILKFQFEGHSPENISIRYLSAEPMDEEVRQAFQAILDLKGASPQIQVSVTRVKDLPADEKTGKFRLVVLRPSS